MTAKVNFYLSSSGRSPVEEFLQEQGLDLNEEFANSLLRLEGGESLPMPLSRNLALVYHGLHELRLKDVSGIYRFFYFIKKLDGIYFVHAFKKKTQELPQKEIDIVLKRIKEI